MSHRHDTECASPGCTAIDRSQRITPSDVARTRKQSGPVRTLADMTPEERKAVMESIRRP